MKTVNLKHAEITRGESGPDHVVVWIEGASGDELDFEVDVPRDTAEDYLRRLGFESCLCTVNGTKPSPRGRKLATSRTFTVLLGQPHAVASEDN